MTTPAEIVNIEIARLNAGLEAITDPDEMDAVADNMDAFVARYFTPAQGAQLAETAANLRARAWELRNVVHPAAALETLASLPAATTFTE